MVDAFLEFLLGPMRSIGEVYFENQMIFNSVIVGGACVKILNKRSSSRSESVEETENV
ncbi:hypothetical protein [Halobacillus karajensis]|uniref:Uncharacterized protein n=1 Tax=Halobacillus karajensis TaxID=195088 RepID=A0A024P4N7_9BACI|nr:hypothetical protein [Halobacillus karajensis]CDQ20685.1 hypothetical protein BN982_03038 [Halobacillus karajensis]CDQ23845.1 hypothetical protein BN983_02098 [Halobacillus karajensis]CDQ27323.1 hypothetical protein BN981_01579 [Halobacillus karajensis]